MNRLRKVLLSCLMIIASFNFSIVPIKAKDSKKDNDYQSYLKEVNRYHEVWDNKQFTSTNNYKQAKVVSNSEKSLKLSTANIAGLDNASNRGSFYSTQAADKILNGSIECDITPTTDDVLENKFGIQIRYVDDKNLTWIAYDKAEGGGWYIQRKAMSKGGSNLTATHRTRADLMPKKGQKLHIKVEFEDEFISFWVNNEQIFNRVSIKDNKVPISAGKTGFMLSGNAPDMYVSNIKMSDSDHSDTFNGNYDWLKDTFKPVASNKGKVSVESIAAYNYFNVVTDNKTITTLKHENVIENSNVECLFANKPFDKDSRFTLVLRYKDNKNYLGISNDGLGFYYDVLVNGKHHKEMLNNDLMHADNYKFNVDLIDNKLKITINDKVLLDKQVDVLKDLKAAKVGFISEKGNFNIYDYKVNIYDLDVPEEKPEINENLTTIHSKSMDVVVDQAFPRVVKYDLKTLNTTMYAQPKISSRILINNESIKPTVTSEVNSDSILYHLNVINDDHSLEANIDLRISVKDNILSVDVLKVKNIKGKVNTLEIPSMVLASVLNSDKNAQLAGSNMSTNTTKKGDTYLKIDKSFTPTSKDFKENGYMYAFVSNDKVSAALYSNSTNSKDKRITASPFVSKINNKSVAYMGLRSSVYTIEDKELNEQEEELPKTKVIICGDENQTNSVDWQDGAIAFRKIMNNPNGSDKIKDQVAQRVVENFASQAAHPFMETLDGVKRVNLATDGLGQKVLLKGYASEGHDSAHPDYGEISKRAGGSEDLKYLLKEGKKYGVNFGVHINDSESYPEAKAFSEELVNKDAFGWNWLDESYPINWKYDLKSKNREKRLKELYDIVGNDLGFIYLDVWSQDSWPTRKISNEFKKFGWECANEWGYANEYDSTWNHWAVDLTYGGATLKGINSDIARFIRNHQKDSWIGNYPAYKGSADHPLLGGQDVTGFEGWQGEKNFNEYMITTFETNLPTKFLQHYEIIEWQNDNTIDDSVTNNEEYIKLRSSDKKDIIEVKRKDFISKAREIYKNKVLILDDDKYLIPWLWNEKGEQKHARLYHFNKQGGVSTWKLGSDFNHYHNFDVYELSDTGKKHVATINNNGGEVSINAKANTAYVLYPKGYTRNDLKMDWREKGAIDDPNFTSMDLSKWNISGDKNAVSIIRKADNYNPVLKVENNQSEVKITQPLLNLKPGKQYVAMVLVDNNTDKKVSISVKNSKDKDKTNYTNKSLVENYVATFAHNQRNDSHSHMQYMPLTFTAPLTRTNPELELKVAKGKGVTMFDEIRVIENDAKNQISDKEFRQDFENVAQGLYPFVVGNHQGRATDVRVHLSQKHAPYTDKGWNGRVISDTIDGEYSVKIHQLVNLQGVVIQTIPQTLRFEPNQKYKVSFDYESGNSNLYSIIVSDIENTRGTIDNKHEKLIPLEKAIDPKHIEFEITGSNNGNTYFGIYSNSSDLSKFNQNARTWRLGDADIVIDNLKVEKITPKAEVNKKDLETLYDKVKDTDTSKYTKNSVELFEKMLEEAKVVLDNDKATQIEVDKEKEELEKAYNGLKKKVEVNKKDLEALYDKVKATDTSKYTKDSVESFEKMLEKAKAVLDNDKATQTEVDTIKISLLDAYNKLKVHESTTNKVELEETVDKVYESLDKNKDTDNKHMNEVINHAENIISNPNVSQKEVNEEVSRVKHELDEYVVKTKDESKNTLYLVMIGISSLLIVFFLKKKNRKSL